MKTLQKYVLREVLGPTLLALLALSLVLIIIFLFEKFADVAALLSLPIMFRLILYLLPTLLCMAIPMAVLIGVLLGIGRMTVDSEIKAIRTHGISLYSLFLPVIGVGVVAVGLVLFNSLYLAPKMMTQSLTLLEDHRLQLFQSLEPGRFEEVQKAEDNGITLYFSEKDEKSSLLKNVYLWFEGRAPQPDSKKKDNKDDIKKPDKKKITFAGATEKMRLPLPLADVGNLPAYTVEYWMRAAKIGEQMAAVGFGNSKTSSKSWIQCGVAADGQLRFAHADDQGAVAIAKSRGARSDDEKWHHVACVRESGKNWVLYRDGKLVGKAIRTVKETYLDKAKVGAVPRLSDDIPWTGAVGWVRVSNRARTALEIESSWRDGPEKPILQDAATLWVGKPAVKQKGKSDDDDDDKEEKPDKTLFLASSGSITSDEERQTITLNLNEGSIHLLGNQDEMYSTISFGRLRNELELEADDDYIARGKDKKPQARTIFEINKSIKDYTARGTKSYMRRARELMAEQLQRYSISFASLAFVLIGLPLAIYIRPSGKSIGISISFILIAVYYLIMHTGVVMTQKGSGFGPLLVFLPNVLLTLLGIVLMHRTVHR